VLPRRCLRQSTLLGEQTGASGANGRRWRPVAPPRNVRKQCLCTFLLPLATHLTPVANGPLRLPRALREEAVPVHLSGVSLPARIALRYRIAFSLVTRNYVFSTDVLCCCWRLRYQVLISSFCPPSCLIFFSPWARARRRDDCDSSGVVPASSRPRPLVSSRGFAQ
jgi:hypothetical protein